MTKARKVGIIGVGHVGPHVANSLLLQGLVDELYLCDTNADKVKAEWQDLHDSLSFCPYNARVYNCGDRYEELADCDVIVNAAGKVTLCAVDRDGELFFGTDAVRTWANRVVDAGFKGVFVNISNPCDVIATEIWHLTDYDPKKIIGSGTGLDSSRLRAQISFATGDLDPKSINAYMISEHGASMLAAWKSASIAGKLLSELAEEAPERFAFDKKKVEELGRSGGYVAYEGKQCTEYAVANSAVRVIAAVFHDEHSVMAASTLMEGEYGEEGIFTSLPCIIGRGGVEQVLQLDLSDEERAGFHASCEHIRSNIARLEWW